MLRYLIKVSGVLASRENLALTLSYIKPFSCFLNTQLVTHISGFPISILVVGELSPPFWGGAPGVGDVGSNHRLVGGAVCITYPSPLVKRRDTPS